MKDGKGAATATATAPATGMPTRHVFLTAFTVVAAVVAFFPLIGGFVDNMEASTLRDSLTSSQFRESSYVIVGLAFTFVVMRTCNSLGNSVAAAYVYKRHQKFTERLSILAEGEMFLFFAGSLVVPCNVFLPSTASYAALAYVCSASAQLICYTGFILVFVSRYYGQRYFPWWAVTMTASGLYTSMLLWPWAENRVGVHEAAADRVLYILYLVQWASVGVFLLLMVRWLYSIVFLKLVLPRVRRAQAMFRELSRSRSRGDTPPPAEQAAAEEAHARESHDADLQYFPVMYTMSCVLCLAAIAACNSFPVTQYELTPYNLLQLNLPVLVLMVFMMVFASQWSHYEAVTYLFSLLSAKAEYVRYISHELRTPLNAAHSGLQLLLSDLSLSKNPEDVDRLDTLNDVATSISTTTDILNDLLTYEKMESGAMVLHKSDINVKAFVESTVDIFYNTARGKNVTLKVEMCDPSVPLSEAVHETDLIRLDKFKCSQIIRNFVSNALKFTGEGGIVAVRVCFVEDDAEEEDLKAPSSHANSRRSGRGDTTTRAVLRKVSNLMSPLSPRRVHSMGSINAKSRKSNKAFHVGVRGPAASSEKSGLSGLGPGAKRGMLRISVMDSGAGISKENQKRLFKEIVQFSPEKLQAGGGSGFGLFICKGIVDLHKGNIGVTSEGEGHGSTFFVELPMKRAPKIRDVAEVSARNRMQLMSRMASRRFSMARAGSSNSIPMRGSHGPVVNGRRISNGSVNNASLLLGHAGRGGSTGAILAGGGSAGGGSAHRSAALRSPLPAPSSGSKSDSEDLNRSSHDVRHPSPTAPGRGSLTSPHGSPNALLPLLALPMLSRVEEGVEAESPRPVGTGLSERHGSERNGQSRVQSRAASKRDALVNVEEQGDRDEGRCTTYRILLVDDSALNRKLLGKLLKSLGHTCDEAVDGLDALNKAKNERAAGRSYDAILMDYVMPNMDGPTATAKLRAEGILSPVFGVTGNGHERDIKAFMDAGANRVLVKPIDINDVHSAMASVLVMGAVDE